MEVFQHFRKSESWAQDGHAQRKFGEQTGLENGFDKKCEKIAESFGYTSNKRVLPEIIRNLITNQEADILLRLPSLAEDLKTDLGLSRKAVEEILSSLYKKGFIIETATDRGAVFGLIEEYDETLFGEEKSLEKGSILNILWSKWHSEESDALTNGLEENAEEFSGRVLPVDLAVTEQERKLIPAHESIGRIISDAGLIAVTSCRCRAVMHNCGAPIFSCLMFGDSAKYFTSTGRATGISMQKAEEIVRDAEANGLIHTAANYVYENGTAVQFICNCCSCCCFYHDVYRKSGGRLGLVASNYRSEVDEETCERCGECIEACHFDAVGFNSKGTVFVDLSKCKGCGLCCISCPTGSLCLSRIPGSREIKKREWSFPTPILQVKNAG